MMWYLQKKNILLVNSQKLKRYSIQHDIRPQKQQMTRAKPEPANSAWLNNESIIKTFANSIFLVAQPLDYSTDSRRQFEFAHFNGVP